MLFLVGAGLIPEHITLQALDILKKCEKIFLDTYTSTFAEGTLLELEKIVGKKIFPLKRNHLEENSGDIFALAKKNNIAVLVFGNPLTATTHIQLVLDARRQRIKTEIIAGISITNFLAKTGLDEYRFGRTCTIAEHKKNFEPDSFFGFIESNQKSNLHTLCLLDTGDGKKFMSAGQAIELLEKIAKKKGSGILSDCKIVIMAAAGGKNEKIIFCDFETAKKTRLNVFPQSLIICADLNEKEKEVTGALNG